MARTPVLPKATLAGALPAQLRRPGPRSAMSGSRKEQSFVDSLMNGEFRALSAPSRLLPWTSGIRSKAAVRGTRLLRQKRALRARSTTTQSLNFRLRAERFQTRIAIQEGGKPVKVRCGAERAPADLGGPQRRQRLSRRAPSRRNRRSGRRNSRGAVQRSWEPSSRPARCAGTLDRRESCPTVCH